GHRAGYRRVRDNVFKKELRPRRAVEFGRPFRQFLAFYGFEQTPSAKRQIDHYRHATISRQRNDPRAGIAVIEGVVDLDKVEGFFFHRLLEFSVLVVEGGGDADVTDAPRRFHLSQGRQLRLGVEQIMNGDQIDLVGAESFERLLDDFHARIPAHRPTQADFGGEKKRISDFEAFYKFTDYCFRRAIGRRGIDDF